MACTFCQIALGAAPLAFWAFGGNKSLLRTLGKHVLITGGSEGLGLSIAEEFIRQGSKVSIVSRTQSKLDAAKVALEKIGEGCSVPGSVGVFAADTTDVDQIKAAVEAAEKAHGPIDLLICNAGMCKPGYFIEQSVKDFEHTMNVNYFGTLQTIKVAAPGMLERKKGHICIVGSALSIVGMSGMTTYAPSKWAVRGLADCLRNEFVGTGVDISIAYPPDTDTPGYKSENITKPKECVEICAGDVLMQPAKVAKNIVNGIRRRQYHIPPPDLGQEMIAARMASLSPCPGSLVLNILLAPILVIVAIFYYKHWDSIVAKAVKAGRAPWKSQL